MATALIVDDSKFMRKIIAEALSSGGHTIVGEADNGQDGIKLYEELKPDFVTMDITMGGKDGMRAIREIKNKYPGAKIIVISALNENTIKMNDENISADLFITKPFTKEELLSVVNKIV
ncbi:MAG TPA: response regulator [Spirochaetota bacterium]|jgi:two-component system chemotaxis response regulator CheY|nr:response regulator [Spirochaetota bacterium]HOK02855.1 response regulator [Spirochaetota bacterium]HOK93043.1 response regulator [Spirochaetota bacterium]HON15728.1 response regulator [Spirochaetota bacterium]HPD79071.1 response regulator [Spirochaetota bacterium]